MPRLEATATAANVKKLDPDAYGVKKRDGWCKLVLGDQEFKTRQEPGKLDPQWEETFTFEVCDPATQKLQCSFYLGDVQIGVTNEFILSVLKKGLATYKGMAVPGGKVDFMLKAVDFGVVEEEQEEESADWMDFCGAEGAMAEAEDEDEAKEEEKKEETKEGVFHLTATATAANVKKLDPDAYGVKKRDGWCKLVLGNQEFKTRQEVGKLDPMWEETFTFEVTDPATQKLQCSFYLGDVQIGVTNEFILSVLKKGLATYKGMAVPGGKVDFMLKAVDFGVEEEEKEEESADWMSFV
eukprot:NODE_814_length_1153_cov_624.315217_g659_i0.p1 GENE.NODE_814_length_1153_cov_624.315217_g659_i0~~NODE_814_length_1153_cov_624.315217_g659_i0.p1  ORF type:complete len:296 (+),score=128.41 NODE_814_length_1153_cov_624.315217_g659_i0:64-951(+)